MRLHVDPVRRAPDPSAAAAPPARRPPAQPRRAVLALQRTHGNRRVAGWAATRVGSPADPAERDAEQVARALGGPAAAGGTVGADHGDGPVPPAVTAGITAARGGGVLLPDGVRALMEGALGADLGAVRVHTGPAAGRLSRALGARAFTSGSDIFLGAGEPGPGSAAGRGLLAHELTHVVQQQASPGAPIRRALEPKHLKAPPTKWDRWLTPDGTFDLLDGRHPKRKNRAGTVEAVIPPVAPPGSVPSNEKVLGWHWVHQFAGTQPGNGSWVRFHLLNENLGGTGIKKLNLVPTTQATNKNAEWTTRFDEKAKEEHNKGRALHFIATVTYHDPVAAPRAPGDPYLHYFPREIEGEYRVRRGSAWADLAKARLAQIPKPPLDPDYVPTQLGTATADALKKRHPKLDPGLARIIPQLADIFSGMPPGSTLQRVYDRISHSAVSWMSRQKGRQGFDHQKIFDRNEGWWPTLERSLRGTGQGRPLVVNDDVDLRGVPKARTRTDEKEAADLASRANRAKALEQKRADQRKADLAKRRKMDDDHAAIFDAIPDDMVISKPSGKTL